MIAEQFAELRAWLGTWSGKLAAVAAPIGGMLADNAISSLGLTEYVPAGWPRAVFVIAVIASVFIVPKAAAKKDQANASAEG